MMDEPKKSTKSKNKTKSSSSSSKTAKDGKEKEEYSSEFLRQKLREFFNHSDFKSTLQKDAIKEIMRGKRDVYISMPTGSGKSLCYQLPGMLHENKITIVFSPLIALIKDQMDHLTKLKICAESLNSKMTVKERERVINDLKSIKPNTKFLYITPEQAATDFFRGLLDSIVKYNKLALVAVDECHCVSEMGHQFRKDYLKLGQLRLRYPTIKWIALTATASKDVTDDVFKQLALKESKSFKTPCFRKNLYYDIIYKNSIQDDYIHLKEFAQKCLKSKTPDEKPNKAPCGIIYCRTRESVERVAIGLSKQNVATKAYHAGLNDKERKQVQEDWTNGKFPVICATNSFGMGVDKSSVRFVVHWDVPQNIAAYYQESGRAGRDGKQSYCRLYYCRQEVKTIHFLLNQALQKDPDNVKSKRSVKEFDKLVEHCETLRCRHLLFSRYFGDEAPPDCKKRQLCDVCKDSKQAEKNLETFHRLALNSFSSKIMQDADFDGADLYEGGRNAVHQAEASYSADYGDDDDFGASSAKRDAKAKKETSNLIQKEFERRKQKIELAKKLEQTQTRSFGIRIKSSIHTNKISGLDVKKRESYLDFLLKVLKENAEKSIEKLPHELKACDFEDIAAELEYNCFTKNRVLAMYTKAITVERLRIDRSTKNKELLPEIKNHVPKKRVAHGGSAEAMQRDLNDFMKEHNIAIDVNNTTATQNTTTQTNVGFQTARQINNKLKEPNRMKKDPLTQMSINSFFSTAAIKREPPDEHVDNNENEVGQQAKRRKVDENSGVRIKSEPMETTEHEKSVNIKGEPIEYDSDAGTDKESDDEAMNETEIPVQSNNAKRDPKRMGNQSSGRYNASTNNAQNAPNDETNPAANVPKVKIEQNDEDENADTDEASDNEDGGRTQLSSSSRQTNRKTTSSTSQRPRNQTDQFHNGNESPTNMTQTRPNAMENRTNVIMPQVFEAQRQPVIEEDEPMTMVVSEPVRYDEDIKNEPDDNPTMHSGDETYDETTYNRTGDTSRRQNRQNVVPNALDRYEQQTSTSQSDFWQPSATQTDYSQPSTSRGSYDSLPSTSTGRHGYIEPPPQDSVNSVSQHNESLYNFGSKSIRQVNSTDGQTLLRLNRMNISTIEAEPEAAAAPAPQDLALTDNDIETVLDDLGEEIEKYRGDVEKQYEAELLELENIKLDTLNSAERMAFIKRLDELKRKGKKIMDEKQREEVERTEKEKKEFRNKFMLDLYGLDFNLEVLDRKLGIYSRSSESSRRDSSSEASGSSEEKKKFDYDEFMNKPKIKLEQKTMRQHHATLALNEHIRRMKDENKLDTVPQPVIDKIKEDKTAIKNVVEKYLMPYFKNGTINKKTYEVICKEVTRIHFESNDYDTDRIRGRVSEMVQAVLNAIKARKENK